MSFHIEFVNPAEDLFGDLSAGRLATLHGKRAGFPDPVKVERQDGELFGNIGDL